MPGLSPEELEKKLNAILKKYSNESEIQEKVRGIKSDSGDNLFSDHLPRNYQVKERYDKFKVMTWNMMNKCHDKASCSPPNQFTNNPWNVNEDERQVNSRRCIQYDFLLMQLRRNNFSAIFLQEINELASIIENHPYPEKMTQKVQELLKKEELTEEEKGILLAFNFLRQLNELGYTAHATTKDMHCKPMVTIINTAELTVAPDDNPKAALPATVNGKKKHTAFVLNAKSTSTNTPINLVNLHLDYETDYVESILDLQQSMVKQGIMGIMAGDTNHPPNSGLIGAIGDWKHTSNIDTDESSGELTDRDLRTSRLKNYDLLFVNPSSTTSSVTAKELDGWYFTVENGIATINPINEKTKREYISKPGLPWMKKEIFDALLKDGFIKATTDAAGAPTSYSFTEKATTNKQQILALIRKMNAPNLQIFDLTYEKLKDLLPTIKQAGHNKYTYKEVTVGSDDPSFKGNVVWQKPTKDDPFKHEKITIARVFHANDNVKLEFPNLKNSAKQEAEAHVLWITSFLQELSKQNKGIKHVKDIPVVVANGFKPEILQELLEEIGKINATPSPEERILLKFECADNDENYKELKEQINLHNKQVDNFVNAIHKSKFHR